MNILIFPIADIQSPNNVDVVISNFGITKTLTKQRLQPIFFAIIGIGDGKFSLCEQVEGSFKKPMAGGPLTVLYRIIEANT